MLDMTIYYGLMVIEWGVIVTVIILDIIAIFGCCYWNKWVKGWD